MLEKAQSIVGVWIGFCSCRKKRKNGNRHIGRLDREILKKDRAAAEAKETISVLKCEADTKERGNKQSEKD